MAEIASGSVTLDAEEWVTARVGSELDELADAFRAFVADLADATAPDGYRVPVRTALRAFVTARAGGDGWKEGDDYTGECSSVGSESALTSPVHTWHWDDPEHGMSVAVLVGAGDDGELTFYLDDIATAGAWTNYAGYVVACRRSDAHVFARVRSGNWDWNNAFYSEGALWYDGVTTDVAEFEGDYGRKPPHYNGETDGAHVILCPRCGAVCTVEAG